MLSQLKQQSLPDKCVVLTADDAYQSIAQNAYPLLKKYQMSMSVFVSSDSVDGKYKAMMNWQQMRDIQGDIMQFYNHSVGHTHFVNLDKTNIDQQIQQAQKRLKNELNVDAKILAYPYGKANLATFKQVKELGYVAFG
ncbi:Polysaccharide deacetylase family protein [uncultured Candidatus Thioglobus sp.]|nr:Polysaccharide deacetylase family protein [uncultured Candidatus Thioglobus sp.]